MMGLIDRYTDSMDSNGNTTSTSHSGWESNIMGVDGQVEQRNIDGVLKKAFDARDERDAMFQQYFPSSGGLPYFSNPSVDFNYNINRHNLEDR
jgi:hypothetical protein